MSLLPSAGVCSIPSCSLQDFLPITCPSCGTPFCKDHVALDRHACHSITTPRHDSAERLEWKKRDRCELDGCSKASLASAFNDPADNEISEVEEWRKKRTDALCVRCSGAFCVEHRHPSTHACRAPDPSFPVPISQKNPEAHALLAKNFPQLSKTSPAITSTTRSPAKPIDPAKLAKLKALEVMKLKRQAKAADPKDEKMNVPIGEKCFLLVRKEGEQGKDQALWFRKTMIAGKALDVLATRLKISERPLSVIRTDTDTQLILGTNLGAQTEDGLTLEIRRTVL